ncbi:hypothetical protein BDR06DRAFT_891073 [Suillus hirtellus]|nr:hypothetical protein BDR06DRAFT_891073 [Suillus hirtellus]
MPRANSCKVPSFNSETLELLEFFKQFKDMANSYSLTGTEKCKTITHYVENLMKHFWVTLTVYESKDYNALKANILDQYSGAAKGQHYTIHNLKHIVISNMDNDISLETELQQYYM